MSIKPTEAELQNTDEIIDQLEEQIDSTDNAGAAESIQQITQLVISLIERVAASAKSTLPHLFIVLGIGVVTGAFTTYYFTQLSGWHIAWALLPTAAVLIPSTVLFIGIKMLNAVASLPENIGDLGSSIANVARDHLHELYQLEDKSLRGLLRWKSYILVAKLLWKLRVTRGQGQNLFHGAMLFSTVANPLFWIVLLAAIIVLLVESAVMLSVVVVHAIFF
ncbi:MAG: hypothetical protein AAGH88_01060 [Planctomycetota bacterium]